MKRIIFLVSLLFIFTSANMLQAQAYKSALGVRLSSAAASVNNSISFKQFISEKTAVEVLFSFGDPVAIGALIELHKPLAAEGLQYFYGAGAYLGFKKVYNPNKQRNESDPQLGGMGIIGLDYKFSGIPLNISLDWKPELNLVSDINFEPAAIGLSARFTFGK